MKKGKLTNKEKLQKRIDSCMTIAELIKQLRELPQKALVGRVGHFGEFNEMDKWDFQVRKAYITESPHWGDKNRGEDIEVLDIHPPYIGEDPD